MGVAVSTKNLTKTYKIYNSNKEKYLDFFLPKSYGKSFNALYDINFEIEQGESVALIGLNGSGKSTLANVIGGYSAATGGEVITNGSVSMISVSAGVDTNLTGIENIQQKGLLLGMSNKEIKELMPEIIEFADLGDFISQPLKKYSSGMKSRLGFAISIHINPDILIIDEALSVGDPTFTTRCLDKMQKFRENGKTIFFVSHSMQQVMEFCDRAIWLQGGKIVQIGESIQIVEEYNNYIKEFNSHTEAEKKMMYEEIRKKQFVEK